MHYNQGQNNASYKHGFVQIERNFQKKHFYSRWQNMKTRCFNMKRKDWKNYGGRGIIVCNEWLDFENFKKEMFNSFIIHYNEYGKKNTTLDRIDVNGNYCKENCRWATKFQQGTKRNTVKFKYKNNLYTIKELQKILNWPYGTIYARIKKNISLDKPNGYRLSKTSNNRVANP